MNPIYKFELATMYGGMTNNYAVHPLYKDDLSKSYEIEQNEKFYRAKLSGKLIFSRVDFLVIANAHFETQFVLVVSISWNAGQTWTEYWRGEFWKTDCKFDIDAQTIEVTPSPVDDYTDILAGMEKEYNLIDLKPEIEHLTITKRPLIQMYVPGESVVSCFLSGMSWEQDCDPVTNENELVNTYHFRLNTRRRIVDIEDNSQLPESFNGAVPSTIYADYTYNEGGYSFHYYRVAVSGGVNFFWDIERDGVVMWRYTISNQDPPQTPFEITLQPMVGSGALGSVKAYIHDVSVYGRYLLDVDKLQDQNTFALPANDIVSDNRNYRRAIGYTISNVVYFSAATSANPTEWGLKQPGQYYVAPYVFGATVYPIGRSSWGNLSIWFAFSALDWTTEEKGRKAYKLKDAYPLHSVISVLLGKIAPNITHEPTPEYSQFLYAGSNPISGDVFDLFISPKSNILAGEYTQPAQKSPITLKMITDMLRDCYRAYWYVEDGKFKIEHIQWFRNGGRYTGTPSISHDLTTEKVTRNGKPWAFGTSQYDFSKSTMPERYQFGWMDDVTNVFSGLPIEVISKFVTPGNIEEINVSHFTTDIDYMLLNPGACSKDGYALMAAASNNVTTPDTQFVDVTPNVLYPLRYQMDGVEQGDVVTISMAAQGEELRMGSCNVAFLANGIAVENIALISMPGEYRFVVKVPQGATQIGIRQLAYTGVAKVKVYGIFAGKYLPFITKQINNVEYRLQNGLLSFADLQLKYYLYDMPAYYVRVNNEQVAAFGITREKKQTIRMPVVNDPDPMQLIKTDLGSGQIEKISVNLSSRNANVTLMFDTTNY